MRKISSHEYDFLVNVELKSGANFHVLGLSETSVVEPMKDGDMGSIRFASELSSDANRSSGKSIVQGEFDDSDGVLVSFSVNQDNDQNLFELDLWRVDFEPLKSFPRDTDAIRILDGNLQSDSD